MKNFEIYGVTIFPVAVNPLSHSVRPPEQTVTNSRLYTEVKRRLKTMAETFQGIIFSEKFISLTVRSWQ